MDSRIVKSNHTLVDALARLDIGLGQSRGRINKLPNEMFHVILSRVPTQHLIRLRSVDKKWMAVIEDICRNKKILMIGHHLCEKYLSELSKQFNGHLKLSNDVVFIQVQYNQGFFSIHLSSQICTLLSKLFPRIEQLYIVDYYSSSCTKFSSMLKQWSSCLTTLSLRGRVDNLDDVNQLTNLKMLNLSGFSVKLAKLSPTFARLEHFCGSSYLDIADIVQHFGTEFTSLAFLRNVAGLGMTIEKLTKMRQLNARFVSNLVRLTLAIRDPQVFRFICKHFSSLQMLRIDLFIFELTTDTIEHFTRLTHLTELRFAFLRIDFASLDVTNLQPLRNIRILSLENFSIVDGEHLFNYNLRENVARFGRLLAAIFPNVETLTIKKVDYPKFVNLLEPHLNLFTNLRTHDFGLN